MIKPSVDDMLKGKESRYALVMAVSKRAREIADKMDRNKEQIVEKPVNLAIKDFKEHKYEILEPERDD